MSAKYTLDQIISKIEGLLAKADHPNTSKVEADIFRAKAEAMMYRYRIEEATLAKNDGAEELPVWREVFVCPMPCEFGYEYRDLMRSVMQHVGVRGKFMHAEHEELEYSLFMNMVGYASDIRFAEMLYSAMRIAFVSRLEPKYNPDLSEQVNAYIMRMAGMEGRRIAMAIYGRDDKSLRPKVRNYFKKEAEARGEDPSVLLGQGNSVKLYRESYAQGFVSETYFRLARMRNERGEVEGAIVMVGRKEAIDEAYFERYPSERPSTEPQIGQDSTNNRCAKCANAKSGYCRDHAWMKPKAYRERAINTAAYEQGGYAARSVDLGAGGKKRLD